LIPDELTKDLATLAQRGLAHEVVEEGPRIFIVFKRYELPDGLYSTEKTDLMIFTTQFYPNAGFDMFWVEEGLKLKGGGIPKNADQIENYLGKRWRRFSYHPYTNKPWNPSEDSVIGFLAYVAQRLRKAD
jgi:hypothetical protein